ncbi:MAG: hypothetical protein D6722_23040 [Bacteroidetes bacterium]|nr:MAG: hypothetical protein D6722_23040 [Bacteroidota bacterium]
MDKYLGLLGLPAADRAKTHGYVVPLVPRRGGYVRKRVFLVGDAAGFADPVTAEGISPAIRSGCLVARALAEAEMDVDRAAELYQQSISAEWLPELAAGRKLARLFYSSATIRGWLMQHQGERLANAMAGVMMGERRYTDHVEAFFRKIKGLRRP